MLFTKLQYFSNYSTDSKGFWQILNEPFHAFSAIVTFHATYFWNPCQFNILRIVETCTSILVLFWICLQTLLPWISGRQSSIVILIISWADIFLSIYERQCNGNMLKLLGNFLNFGKLTDFNHFLFHVHKLTLAFQHDLKIKLLFHL